MRYVQFGCGLSAPKEWINYDSSPSLRIQRMPIMGRLIKGNVLFPEQVRYGDIVKGLPEMPDSVNVVYSSHVLEHLSPYDLRIALLNVKTYLMKSGSSKGIFRFVLPDLEKCIAEYMNDQSDTPGYNFMKKLLVRPEIRPRTLRTIAGSLLGNSSHLWMWDYKSMHCELSRAGFLNIRRAFFLDNPDPMFQQVEERERWINCLGIECTS